MMSESSDDEDIPGLQSVSGSEILEDLEESEDESFSEDTVDINSRHYADAKMWFMFDRTNLVEHVEVVSIYVLCPLLYGHAHQSDRWLSWCNEVGILHSDIEFDLDSLTDKDLLTIRVLTKASNYIKTCLLPGFKEVEEAGGGGGDRQVEDLVRLLQIMEDINMQDNVAHAVHVARRKKWFKTLITDFFKVEANFEEAAKGQTSVPNNQNFVVIGFLFVFNQACEHVTKRVTRKNELLDEFHKNVELHEEVGEELRKDGEDHENKGRYNEAIEAYTTAIVCCPYYYQLYISRAYAYMEVDKYRCSVSDGLRAIHLRPGIVEGHICYILALSASGRINEVNLASEDFYKKFPKDKMKLKRALDQLRGLDKKMRDPTEKDQVMNEKIVATCKQASEEFLAGNIDESIFYFEEAKASSLESKAWQLCWVFSECEKFLVSLHVALGLAYLRRGGKEDAEKALSEFSTITADYEHFSSFPTAFYGMGKSLVSLHRHNEALSRVKKGLESLGSAHLIQLTWPGTSSDIKECESQTIEIKLQQLQQLCEPVLSDAVCRYINCLTHHTSSDLVFSSKDYKGHVEVQCSDSCSIGYHPYCWRKFKSDRVIGSDKDLLNTLCPTPDCAGLVRVVNVYDPNNKVKIKLESEHLKKPVPPVPPSSLIANKEAKQPSQAKKKKKVIATEGSPTGEKAGHPMAVSDLSPEDGSKELFKKQNSKESNKEVPEMEGPKENLESREDTGDAVMALDNRKGVATILRQEEEAKESGKVKSKKVKSHSKEKAKASVEHWNDLFVLPERASTTKVSSTDEDNQISKWGPELEGPAEPSYSSRGFLPLSRDLNVAPHFLSDPLLTHGGHEGFLTSETSEYTRSNSNSSSSSSNSSSKKKNSAGTLVEWQPTSGDKEVLEFIQSYFGEIVRTHGPLDIKDPKILEPVQYLPSNTQELIKKAGGIAKVLVSSREFALQGQTICPIEDIGLMEDSLHISGGAKKNVLTRDSLFSSETTGHSNKTASSMREKSNKPKETGNKETVKTTKGDAKGRSSGDGKVADRRAEKRSTTTIAPSKVKGKGSSSKQSEPDNIKKEEDDFRSEEEEDKESSTSRYLAEILEATLGHDLTRKKREADSESLSDDGSGSSAHSLESEEDSRSSAAHGVVKVDLSAALDKLLSSKTQKRESSSSSLRKKEPSKDKEVTNKNELGHGKSSETPGTDRSDIFSPTNSTCSVSSNSSSSSSAVALSQRGKGSTQKKSSKGKGAKPAAGSAGHFKVPAAPAVPVVVPLSTSCMGVQTDPPLMKDKWVMTDHPQHQTTENYKDRYELAIKEKKDLQGKLETSEDQRYKMQKSHKRELDDIARRTRKEVHEETSSKLREMEDKMKDEKARVDAARKEGADQLKSTKIEIKSLTDKIEKMKKDMSRKEQQADMMTRQLRTEIDRLKDDKLTLEGRLTSMEDAKNKAITRATNADIELLSIRRDGVAKHCEQKIRDIDTFCATIPQGSDLYVECTGYSERLKQALEGYQGSMEEQVRLLKGGRELMSLEVIPPPTVAIPTHLSMFLMRPPGSMYPMMPSMQPGRFPPPVMDPAMVMRPPRPPGMVGPPGGMVGIPGDVMKSVPSGNPSLPAKQNSMGVGIPESEGIKHISSGTADHENSSSSSSSLPGFPALDKETKIKTMPSVPVPETELHNGGGALPSTIRSAKSSSRPPGKKSSFDRVLEKLTPIYPNYTRDDFKAFLREVRHKNKDSLSGVSVDFIAEQVKLLIEQHEKKNSSLNNSQARPSAGMGRGQARAERHAQLERKTGRNFSTEGSCIICYEDMDIANEKNTKRLDCGHCFHADCIRSWFKEQSTCPTCRNHSLLVEDYPILN